MSEDNGPSRRRGATSPTGEPLGVGGASRYRLRSFREPRGALIPVEFLHELPFEPRRVFLVRDVPAGEVRGEHAHLALHQFLVCVAGGCSLVIDDGRQRKEIRLDVPTLGVHVPPMIWSPVHAFTSDAVLLVLASTPYDPDDYVHDYDEFRRLASGEDALI